MESHAFTRTVVLMLAAAIAPLNPALSQTLSDMDRARGHIMLKTIKAEITRDYYDPTFHGIDLEARFKTADEKIDQATSNGQLFGIIAQTLIDFDDSHFFFIPPPRAVRTDYGRQYQAVSDKVYVVAVKPGSDAESKGFGRATAGGAGASRNPRTPKTKCLLLHQRDV